MKYLVSLLWIISLSVGISYAQGGSITGQVHYKNIENTLMKDSTIVYLLNQSNTILATDTVDINGFYLFENLDPGNYIVKANSYKKPGGINAADAQAMILHYIGIEPYLTGLNLTVADVNNSGGNPGAVDALAVQRFFTHHITTFAPAPFWKSTIHNVSVTDNTQIIQNIQILCNGDVDGNFIPY